MTEKEAGTVGRISVSFDGSMERAWTSDASNAWILGLGTEVEFGLEVGTRSRRHGPITARKVCFGRARGSITLGNNGPRLMVGMGISAYSTAESFKLMEQAGERRNEPSEPGDAQYP